MQWKSLFHRTVNISIIELKDAQSLAIQTFHSKICVNGAQSSLQNVVRLSIKTKEMVGHSFLILAKKLMKWKGNNRTNPISRMISFEKCPNARPTHQFPFPKQNIDKLNTEYFPYKSRKFFDIFKLIFVIYQATHTNIHPNGKK